MHISAKADYAMRALLVLAAANDDKPMTGETVANAQELPVKFVQNILVDLRRTGIVASFRGAEGGFKLGRPADEISVAQVIRAVDGPLADIRGLRPEDTTYTGAAEHLQEVWVAVRASLRLVLEEVTLADVASGGLPEVVTTLAGNPDAWAPRKTR